MKAESEFEKVKRGADDKGGGMELELCNICRHKHFKISNAVVLLFTTPNDMKDE